MGKVGRLCITVELNLLLPFIYGLLASYLPTPDPARRLGITPPAYTKRILVWA